MASSSTNKRPNESETPSSHTNVKPEVQIAGDLYSFKWPNGIEIEADRVTESVRDGFSCEITVVHQNDFLHRAKFNPLAERTKAELRNKLAGILPSFPWNAMIEAFCFLLVESYRQGEPPTDLRNVDPEEQTPFLLYPFFAGEGGTIIYGDGGAGKTSMSDSFAACIATGTEFFGPVGKVGPVGIADWDSTKESHAERIRAACRGLGISELPEIYHVRMTSSLWESRKTLARMVYERGIVAMIIDHVGAACDGSIEESQAANRLFNAANEFGVPWIGIGHVNQETARREADGDDNYTAPFGSRYLHNRARMTWYVKRIQEPGDPSALLHLRQTKFNNGPRIKDRAYRLQYDTDDSGWRMHTIHFEEVTPETAPELLTRLPLNDRILHQLTVGKRMPAQSLAQDLGEKPDKVISRLKEMEARGKVGRLPNGMWEIRHHAPDLDEIPFPDEEPV